MNSRSRIDYTTASDSVLVIALGRADEAAMQEIFSRHAGPVFGLAKTWASRKLGDSQPGTVTHGAAQIASVVL